MWVSLALFVSREEEKKLNLIKKKKKKKTKSCHALNVISNWYNQRVLQPHDCLSVMSREIYTEKLKFSAESRSYLEKCFL